MEGVTMHPREPSPLLLHVFPSFTTGGSQTRFAAIANHFGPQFRHAIIAMDGDTGCRTRLDPSLQATFHAVPVRHGRTLGNIRPFRAMLRQLAPNALFTYNWGTIDWTLANLGGAEPCTKSAATACLLDQSLAGGVKSGYNFVAIGNTPSTGANTSYLAGAAPVVFDRSGKRLFCSTDKNVIRTDLNTGGSTTPPDAQQCMGFTALQ